MSRLPRDLFGERVHLLFVGTALAIALCGGLLLAVALPLDAALRGHVSAQWVALAQVHGHLQTVGFVGLFIVGMAYRLLPAFSGREQLRFLRLVPASFYLLAGGVLARAVGQPAAEHPLFAAIMVVGAWAELFGAACFALNVFALAWPAARAGREFAPFFLAGASWFVVQAAMGAIWHTALGTNRSSILAADRDAPLIFLQFFGFHLMFILGVALRSFPVFFAAPRPSARSLFAPWWLVQAGIAACVLGAIIEVFRSGDGWLPADLGTIALGTGLVWATSYTGWWRAPTRIRPASRPVAYTLQPAMAWLVIAGIMLAGFAVRALLHGDQQTFAEIDSTRHVVAIGVVLMTIVGMAQLLLPEFASERLVGRQGAWRGIAFSVALSLATVGRVGPRLFATLLPGQSTYWSMAGAGLTVLLVLVLFASFYARGVRDYGHVIALAAARRERRGPPDRDW